MQTAAHGLLSKRRKAYVFKTNARCINSGYRAFTFPLSIVWSLFRIGYE